MNGYDLKTKLNLDLNPFILDQLLIHSSAFNEFEDETNINDIKKRNEYFSIAGKDLLDLLMYLKLYQNNNIITPYDLSTYIHAYKNQVYNAIYDYYDIDNFIYLGKGEIKNNIKYIEIIERIIYYIYMNEGFINLYNNFSIIIDQIEFNDTYDYRSLLQEYSQPLGVVPTYKIIDESGPDNAKQFIAEVKIYDKTFSGKGKSKKLAYKEAAKACCLFYKISIVNKSDIKTSLIKENKKWIINSERKRQLSVVYNRLTISNTELPLHYLDASFTHKSIENEKGNLKYYDNNNFLSMIGSIILSFVISEYLCDKFIDNGEMLNLVSIKGFIASNENLEKFIPKSWEKLLIGSKGLKINNTNITSLIVDSFKSILCSLFLNAYRKCSKDPFYEVNKLVYEICNESIVDIEPNYTSVLQSTVASLELILDEAKIDYAGNDNNRIYYYELKLSDSKCRINSLYKIGEGRTIKKARNNASYEMLKHLENILNANDKTSGSQGYYYFLNNKSLSKAQKNLSSILHPKKGQLESNSNTPTIEEFISKELLTTSKYPNTVDKNKENKKSYNHGNKRPKTANNNVEIPTESDYKINNYGTANPDKIIRTIEATKRNTTLVKRLKELYNYECQVCGLRIPVTYNRFICEVHHIQPLGLHSGSDKSENMIVLCPNHHAMFDNGIISIDLLNKKVIYANNYNNLNYNLNVKHKIDYRYIEYYNKNILIEDEVNDLNGFKHENLTLDTSEIICYGDTVIIRDLESEEVFEIILEKSINKIFMTPLQKKVLGLRLLDKFDFTDFKYEIVNILKQIV